MQRSLVYVVLYVYGTLSNIRALLFTHFMFVIAIWKNYFDPFLWYYSGMVRLSNILDKRCLPQNNAYFTGPSQNPNVNHLYVLINGEKGQDKLECKLLPID